MTLSQTYDLAVSLMRQHGLIQKGWCFDFDQAKRRFGCCNYTKKEITLSAPMTLINDEAQVVDTILHEIAHALVGHGHGHDSVWKAKCREIGAKPERCYTDEDTTLIAGKYQAVCGGCGKTHTRHKRVPRGRRTACLCQNHIKDWNKKQLLEYKVAR